MWSGTVVISCEVSFDCFHFNVDLITFSRVKVPQRPEVDPPWTLDVPKTVDVHIQAVTQAIVGSFISSEIVPSAGPPLFLTQFIFSF